MQVKNGSLLLFRLFGVNVFVHWSWLLAAVAMIWWSKHQSDLEPVQHSLFFHAVVYLALFLIVLTHEFGHALACKSVGGKAERIVLWPLGGLAFVQPPNRPGAMLWSIAAGPLVNVVLLPLTVGALFALRIAGAPLSLQDFAVYLVVVNAILLAFNMLPFYPLDGGQILRSLLWFVLGRGMSLVVAAVIGLVGAAGLILAALIFQRVFLGITAIFLGMQSINAIKIGRVLMRLDTSPRHPEVTCPHCGFNPPAGDFWGCPCGARFDTFVVGGQCPRCARTFDTTACPFCGNGAPLPNWFPAEYPSDPAAVAEEPPPGAA